MNEEVILKKILNDAEKESKQIIDNANQEIEKLKMNLTDLENQLNKKSNDEIEKYRAEYSEFCLENLKFNKNKLILDAKNFVMKDFKKNAVETIKNLKKAEMIAFLSKIITQNAENSETLIYNIDSIEDAGIINQPMVEVVRWKFAPSEVSYFDDALFIGDSRTNGIYCYGTFENATFFAEDGMNIYGLWQDRVSVEGYGKVRLETVLNNQSFSKIYIMMGINELGEDQNVTAQKYKEALDRLHELEPEAIIYICSNLHVSAKQSQKHATFNNANINSYNEKISAFADEETFFYLDVNQVFNDEAGNLQAEYTWDNIHLYGRYYDEWCEWFCQNTVVKYNEKVEGYIKFED